jgi:hypothetical protein
MRTLKKIALYTSITLVVLLISAAVSLYLYKDRIIQQFIREANKSLGTPVTIGQIDVNLIDDFPRLSIVFRDVYIEDSHPGKYPLLTAQSVSFSLDAWEVYQGRYRVEGLRITDSETQLRIDKSGRTNYTIVKSGSGSAGSVAFDLKDVRVVRAKVSYVDLSVVQHHTFSTEAIGATILARGDTYQITAEGDVTTGQIGIGQSKFLEEKMFLVQAALDYDDLAKNLVIRPSTLSIGDNRFEVQGSYDFKEKNTIDLQILGKDTDVQSLLALMPPATSRRFAKYESRGDVYFDATLRGEISRQRSPLFTVSFGFREVTLVHPDFQSSIDALNLEGSFRTPSLSAFHRAELSLKNISATLNGTPFSGNFHLRNFDDPFVSLDFHGEPKASDLLNFFPLPDVIDVAGSLKAHVSLTGQLALLKSKATAQQVKTEGTVELDSLHFTFGKRKLRFSNLNGTLQFNNNDLAMSNLRGSLEKSDFLVNGFFKNIVTYAIFENQPIGIEADLAARYLDMDRLFEIGFSETGSGPYAFSISPALHLNFNCQVDSLVFKRFRAGRVKGDLLVKGQVAVSRNIHLNAMGGALQLSGIVDARNPKAIDLITSATLKGIHLDSLFYVFGNFQQDFIGHQHLKGEADAVISLEATLNEALRIFPETLIADASTTIRKGELNNFAPLRGLSKYLDDEGLNRLRFADLTNDIHIENKTVYIPQMEIRSNVTSLVLSGTHTFDKHIDYRVIAPLRNKKKIDPDEAFGAIEEDLQGRSKIYLKITGTTDDYKIQYDQVAVRKKIASDIKKEVQELKEAFRLKGKKKKKELELQKDDYFDWEEKP